MSRRVINLAAAAVTFTGATMLAKPAHATLLGCTEEQWLAAEEAANVIVNDICPGGVYSLTCSGNAIHFTLVACSPGNG